MAFGADISETLGNVGNRASAHGYGKADEIRKQYTGYEHDDESGLDFAQARYYNATHGRFTSIDPLTASANVKDPQTFNRYTYAMNSPYKFTDPLGLISSSTNACGQSCRNTATSSEMDTARVGKGFSDEGHQEAEVPDSPVKPPDALVAEAMARISSVIVTGGGKPNREGIMEISPEMHEQITKALNSAWGGGVKVGGLAKATDGVVILTGGVTGEETSVGPTLEISKDGISAGVQGSQGKYAEKNYESLAVEAIKQDKNELAENTVRTATAAGELQNETASVNTLKTVATSKGNVSKSVLEKDVSTGYGFWNAAIKKEVDLMYRRGVRFGYDNTLSSPAINSVPSQKK